MPSAEAPRTSGLKRPIALASESDSGCSGLGRGSDLGAGGQFLALVIGLVLFVGAALTLFRDYRAVSWATPEPVEPAFAHFLFHGYEWVRSGWEKIGESAWTEDGEALLLG